MLVRMFMRQYARSEDLHQEVVHDKGIHVEHNAPNVSNDFTQNTGRNSAHVAPGLVANTIPKLSTEKSEKAKEIDDVAGHGGTILDGGPLHGASALTERLLPFTLAESASTANVGWIGRGDVDVLGVNCNALNDPDGPDCEMKCRVHCVYVRKDMG